MENTLVNPSKKQWIALVFCVIAGCYGPMFQYCHGTLADYIMGEYGLSYTQWGTINSVYSFACGFGLFSWSFCRKTRMQKMDGSWYGVNDFRSCGILFCA